MGNKLEMRGWVAYSLLASAVGCGGQVAERENNGSAAAGAGGRSASGSGGDSTMWEPGAGRAATGGATNPVPPDDACVAVVLAEKFCTVCHSAASAPLIGSGLVLEGTNLGARLSTTKATYVGVPFNASSCVAGALIIDAESPADSVLLKKVAGVQACGDKMPPGTGLHGADLACIRNWINKF